MSTLQRLVWIAYLLLLVCCVGMWWADDVRHEMGLMTRTAIGLALGGACLAGLLHLIVAPRAQQPRA